MYILHNNNLIFYYLCAKSTAKSQLQTQHSVETGNYIIDKQNVKTKTNYRQAVVEDDDHDNDDEDDDDDDNNKFH
jgi:hypothetical protein